MLLFDKSDDKLNKQDLAMMQNSPFSKFVPVSWRCSGLHMRRPGRMCGHRGRGRGAPETGQPPLPRRRRAGGRRRAAPGGGWGRPAGRCGAGSRATPAPRAARMRRRQVVSKCIGEWHFGVGGPNAFFWQFSLLARMF